MKYCAIKVIGVLYWGAHSIASTPAESLPSLRSNTNPAEIDANIRSDARIANAATKAGQHARCQAACTFLGVLLKGKVALPQSSVYEAQNIHWSQQQAEVRSVCRVAPIAAIDISATILTLRAVQCPFAVKSGGHAAFKGASNIEGGITIDLVNLNQITVAADRKQVSVGPGNRWLDVYAKLDQLGISVVGGRVEDIGVGGLTLGGGISFLSHRFGFASDNVNAYEVVFADGSINTITSKTHPDLFWALRGGGNNFGIVTRFNLKAFPQGQFWGGRIFYLLDKLKPVLQALTDINVALPSDPFATLYIAYVYSQSNDGFVIVPELIYGKPVASPPIFKNFSNIANVGNTLRTANLSEQIAGTNRGYNFRQTTWTATFKNDAVFLERILAIWEEEIAPLKKIDGWVPAAIFQPLSKGLLEKSVNSPFDITPADGPLILFNQALQWTNSADDTRVYAAARNTINRATIEAKAKGLDFKWIYQNYAAQEQNVFEGYGSANHAKLRIISKKYDPEGVFQRLQPGYFKLW